jgi:hypothetical protein
VTSRLGDTNHVVILNFSREIWTGQPLRFHMRAAEAGRSWMNITKCPAGNRHLEAGGPEHPPVIPRYLADRIARPCLHCYPEERKR